MKRCAKARKFLALVCLSVLLSHGSLAQEVIDRIVARLEHDVILLSDVRLLAHYQLLVDGKSEPDSDILERLIDQWIVRNEASIARTRPPTDAEVERALQRLQQSYASKEDYDARRKLAGLTDDDIRRITVDQVYLNSYLDSRFRPSVQVDEQAIQDFYQNVVLPRAKARGQSPPSLDAAHDYIQEALVQRGINEQADRWLKESHTRLHITKMPEDHHP